MKYREVERRLEELEHADQERQQRVYERVWHQLPPDDQECFVALVQRHDADPMTSFSEHEASVIVRIDVLTLADAESRLCDLIDTSGGTNVNV